MELAYEVATTMCCAIGDGADVASALAEYVETIGKGKHRRKLARQWFVDSVRAHAETLAVASGYDRAHARIMAESDTPKMCAVMLAKAMDATINGRYTDFTPMLWALHPAFNGVRAANCGHTGRGKGWPAGPCSPRGCQPLRPRRA